MNLTELEVREILSDLEIAVQDKIFKLMEVQIMANLP